MKPIVLFSFVSVGILSICWPAVSISWILWSMLLLPAFILGIACSISAHIYLSSYYRTPAALLEHIDKDLNNLRETIYKHSSKPKTSSGQQTHLPVVFGRTVDSQLQQLIELILRDFLLVWLKDYAYKPEVTIDQFKEDLWGAIQDLYDRISRVDSDRLIACDMVTKITQHFEKIRIAQTCVADTNKTPMFAISPYFMSNAAESNFLRQVSEMLIMFLLPRCYSLAPSSYLFKEVLACKILQPAINMITEPDYLNQKILSYVEAQKAAAAVHNKTHEYARSFEDFLKMIQNCNDVDTLKRIRYNIVSEIMQATTLQNMNRARGVEVDTVADGASAAMRGNSNSNNTNRRQIAAARKLKRYITQLSYAKGQCEAALNELGWDGPFPSHDPDNTKVLSLNDILESVLGRRHLSLFLETVCSQGLVGYWTAVEELRSSHRSNWHQLGAEIFYTYIRSPSAEIKVDKETRKRMEAFLLGDKGPEVFYEVQQMVINTLLDKYYQPFLLSDQYKSLINALSNDEKVNDQQRVENSPMEERQLSGDSVSSNDSAVSSLNIGEQSVYARKKLDQLQERLENKTQALQALKVSLKPESKVLELLSKEVSALAGERHRLETHLSRAHTWAQHLGKWRANVSSAEFVEESQLLQFVLVVQKDEPTSDGEAEDMDAISTGWVLLRTLGHFQELHRKLRPICAGIKNLELPSNSFKFLFGKNDKSSLDKAKAQIQKYLDFILEDEHLNQSEAIYAFLSPSSEHLKHNIPSPKKSRFSFSTLFKSGSNDSAPRSEKGDPIPIREVGEEDEISLYLDGENGENSGKGNNVRGILSIQGSNADDGKDAIAEPLYTLMGEVFDMRGVFKWLRKTIISFVQITYGRTINRQIRDTITWIFSESMLHYYISIIMKSWWPGGVLAKPGEIRTQKMKDETRMLARRQFITNVPELLTSLLGTQSAQRGAQKIFDTFQNHMQNKQLFYELIEILLLEVFPELKQHL